MLTVVAIDPGRKGAVARLKTRSETPIYHNELLGELDLWEFPQPDLAWGFNQQMMADMMMILRVQTFPGPALIVVESPLAPPCDSTKSLVTIGTNYGFILGALQSLCPSKKILPVRPQTWKAELEIRGVTKQAGQRLFDRLFNYNRESLNPDSIDAGLLAFYAMLRLVKLPFTEFLFPAGRSPAYFHPYPRRTQRHASEDSNGTGCDPGGLEAAGEQAHAGPWDPRGTSAGARKAPRETRTRKAAEGQDGHEMGSSTRKVRPVPGKSQRPRPRHETPPETVGPETLDLLERERTDD